MNEFTKYELIEIENALCGMRESMKYLKLDAYLKMDPLINKVKAIINDLDGVHPKIKCATCDQVLPDDFMFKDL